MSEQVFVERRLLCPACVAKVVPEPDTEVTILPIKLGSAVLFKVPTGRHLDQTVVGTVETIYNESDGPIAAEVRVPYVGRFKIPVDQLREVP